jgi:predicted DNA repair protein MutK
MDDAGVYLMQREGRGIVQQALRWCGACLMSLAPRLMKFLAVVGTIAMFMVGGGILVHGFHFLDEGITALAAHLADVATFGATLATLAPVLGGIVIGMVAGAVVVMIVTLGQRLRTALSA